MNHKQGQDCKWVDAAAHCISNSSQSYPKFSSKQPEWTEASRSEEPRNTNGSLFFILLDKEQPQSHLKTYFTNTQGISLTTY